MQAGDEGRFVAPPSPAEKEDDNPFADNLFDAPLKAIGAARKASKQKSRKALEGNGKPSAAELERSMRRGETPRCHRQRGRRTPRQKAQEIARAHNTQRFKLEGVWYCGKHFRVG